MFELTRTVLLLVVGLASILCVALPPNYFLWQLKIVLSEYPHIPLLAALIVFGLPGYERNLWLWPQLTLTVAAVVMSLYPIVGAATIANSLPQELDKTFGKAEINEKPFSYFKLFVPDPTDPAPDTHTYFQDSVQELKFDLYKASGKKRPVVIVIHGGGWDSGDRTQMHQFDRYLASKNYNVVAIDYSLAPQFQCPKPVIDVQTCIDYLKVNSDKLNVDPNNIVLLGRSAGGQIALQAGYSLHRPEIKGIVAFYSPADMVWGYSLSVDNAILKSKTLITQYVGGKLDKVRDNYENATAMTHVTTQSPPTLMIHGKKDNMVAFGHNLHLIEKLKPAGVPHYLLALPWATHGADWHLNGPSGQLSSYAVEHFLHSTFKE